MLPQVYTVGNLALDEIREDNLKTFIDSVRFSLFSELKKVDSLYT